MNFHAPVRDRVRTNMTVKGQVLIPKAMRDRAGLTPGQPVSVGINDRGEVVVMPDAEETHEERLTRIKASIRSVVGTMKTEFKTTDEYMDEIRPWRHERP